MSRLRRPTPARNERANSGFILIAVLWLLAALATLVSVGLVYGIETAVASRVPDNRLQAEGALRAGVELTAYRVLTAPKPQRPTHGSFETKVGQSKIFVRFLSESARIDLNAASKEVLTGLFVALGADKSVAGIYADHVVAWRQKRDSNSNDAEAAAYSQAGLTYAPREGPFDDALELSLILGLPPAIVDKMLPLVTVYSGTPQIDVANADPAVLASLPNMTPDIIKNVLLARANGVVGQPLIEQLGPAGNAATIEPSDALRASILVETGTDRKVHAEIVFRLTDDKPSPFEILHWRDDFDGPIQQG
jgi:general secretion pathway protein K